MVDVLYDKPFVEWQLICTKTLDQGCGGQSVAGTINTQLKLNARASPGPRTTLTRTFIRLSCPPLLFLGNHLSVLIAERERA